MKNVVKMHGMNKVRTILGNNQLDTQLLYFTIRLLWFSTCFEHYMLIIRRVNCIDAASGIVTLSEFLILVFRRAENGGVLPKHVAVNRPLYFCIYQVCMYCHKWEICPATEQIPRLLQNLGVCWHAHKRLLLSPFLYQIRRMQPIIGFKNHISVSC
jgi:hypothetical protein